MRKVLTIIAAVSAAALLAGGLVWFAASGAFADFDWRMIMV